MTALEGIAKKPDAHSRARRIPAGFSAKLTLAQKVIRRRLMLARLRRIAKSPDWEAANGAFRIIVERTNGDEFATDILSSATLRGAREAEGRGQLTTASRFWVWHTTVSGDLQKASRNLARCARLFTKDGMDRPSIAGALGVWKLLASIDTESTDSIQGQAWCHAGLARIAEESADFSEAQTQWSAALQLIPDNTMALEGLRRGLEVDPPGARGADRSVRAQALHQRLVRETRQDYGSQCAAASLLLDFAAPDLARGFIEAALWQRKGSEATVLLFRCHAAAGRYSDAVAALTALADTHGNIPPIPLHELRSVLAHISPEAISEDALWQLAHAANARSIAPVLLPLVIVRSLPKTLITLCDRPAQPKDWPIETVLQAVDRLWDLGEQRHSLGFLANFLAIEAAANRFAVFARECDVGGMEQALLRAVSRTSEFCEISLVIAEIYASRGDSNAAMSKLCRIAEAGEFSEHFYQEQKARIAALTTRLLHPTDSEPETKRQLANLIASFAPQAMHAFYRSPKFLTLHEELATASRFSGATLDSRPGQVREHYFEHHMERRENRNPETIESDYAFCDAVLQYFGTIAAMQPVEGIPVGTALKARLSKPGLSLGPNRFADVLMSYAILRERPVCDLRSKNLFETVASWYIGEFMPANKVPSICLPPDALTHFNTVIKNHPGLNIAATRFAQFHWERSETYRSRYDLANSIDTLLFDLELITKLLPGSPQNRPFIAAMAQACGNGPTFVDHCIAALALQSSVVDRPLPFTSVLGGHSRHRSRRPWPPQTGAPQDVLLIGHGTHGTGLGRNFQMVAEALSGPDISLTKMTYETEPARFAEELRGWYTRCRTCPIVIATVNAHDLPALFIKDRYNVLDDCRVVGFFLWETSEAPRVQHLGIRLVDEIWAPTNYVMNVYAPFAPVHVVGKGLFSIDDRRQVPSRPSGDPLRFLAVFDFHSSIERKNPLAVVLAFQKAFVAGERAELVVKASNVNPQHPGNASGQWERLCALSASDHRIRIVSERYTAEEMKQLMRDTSCVVSLHRSEGFGYVLSDAMAVAIPVIGTDYSGNVDFCDAETSFPVAFRPVPVVSYGAHWETKCARWAEPDIESAAEQMKAVYSDYEEALRRATLGRERILKQYSKEAFAARLRERLAAICSAASIDPRPSTLFNNGSYRRRHAPSDSAEEEES